MTAVAEPQVEPEVPAGCVAVFGIVRTRSEWEHLEQVLYYCNAPGFPENGYSLSKCMHFAQVALTNAEWERTAHVTEDAGPAWMAELDRVLSVGCTPYATADEMKVAARNMVLHQRGRRDWCPEGTNSILGQLGLEPIEPYRHERAAFIELFQRVTAAHYGTAERQSWTVRALLRGRPPTA